MSAETNRIQAIKGWKTKDMGSATVQVFGDDGVGTHVLEVRRIMVIALDANGQSVQGRDGFCMIETVEEDATATNEQMLDAVANCQKRMLKQHVDS